MANVAAIRTHSTIDTPSEAKDLLQLALEFRSQRVPIAHAHSKVNRIRPTEKMAGELAARFGPLETTELNLLITELIEGARIEREKRTKQRSSPAVLLRGSTNVLSAVVASAGRQHRHEQAVLADAITNATARSQTLLVEAPTGSGKSLAAVAGVLQALRNGKTKRALIAVPTLHLLKQVRAEARAALQASPGTEQIAVIRGRQQFISQERILDWLASEDEIKAETRKAVIEWMDAQAHLTEDAWATESFQSAVPVAPDLTLRAKSSSGRGQDAGRLAYQEQFNEAHSDAANIIVCTHAMLAAHVRFCRIAAVAAAKAAGLSLDFEVYREVAALGGQQSYQHWVSDMLGAPKQDAGESQHRYGLLPPFDTLIVDEAHELERNVAAASSHDVSLWALQRDESLSQAARNALHIVFAQMVQYGHTCNQDSVHVRDHVSLRESLAKMAEVLAKSRKRSDLVGVALATINFALRTLTVPSYVCTIDYSPVVRYPRLRLGTKSVEMQMAYLWSLTKTNIAMSATMMLPSAGSMLGSDAYVRRMLQMPANTQALYLAGADWLYAPVKVHLAPDHTLVPADTEHESHWATRVAEFVRDNIWQHSPGGVLVLCTSYTTATEIGRVLAQAIPSGQLVVGSREVSTAMQRQAYVTAYEANGKSVWVAIGSAWTGLDLTHGENAMRDRLLTDLVIPRLPFRANRSLTHEVRAQRLGFSEELSAMLMTLKQGIGRLVRRNGIEANRTIWMLDARIAQADSKYGGPVVRLFSRYRKAVNGSN